MSREHNITYETAKKVLDAIDGEAQGDSIDMFLDWYGISESDYHDVVGYLYEQIELLKQ